MNPRPHPKRSKRPHRLDAEIERVERELRRLRAIRHSDLSAEAARDPRKRQRAAQARRNAWKNPITRAAHCAALSASWTPERRKAQGERMRKMRADPKQKAEMLAAQVLAQRTPEFRAKAKVRSTEVWARDKAARDAGKAARDPLEAAIFGGGLCRGGGG